MRLRTLRGMATVPAWRLSFSNPPGPIEHVAVDRATLGAVEDAVGDHLLMPGDLGRVLPLTAAIQHSRTTAHRRTARPGPAVVLIRAARRQAGA
ncbi:hypothetical protein [Streptosporangium vulgare]|uniref:Uncharacterized protein n=1 Tax=Streptosporangium vulgare TaxID=46190 RepID=A0ABV5TEF3_9ACTN